MPVSTRPSNATKRPAQAILDAMQKRRTSAAVQEDNARLRKEKQEQDDKISNRITRVAVVQNKLAVQESNASAARKPRPRPAHCKAMTVGTAQATDTGPLDPPAVQAPATRPKRGAGAATAAAKESDSGSQGQAAGEQSVEDNNIEGMGRRKRVRKTAHRDVVDAVRASQLLADSAVLSPRGSDASPKGNTSTYVPQLDVSPRCCYLLNPHFLLRT